jgi:hypothetical protein
VKSDPPRPGPHDTRVCDGHTEHGPVAGWDGGGCGEVGAAKSARGSGRGDVRKIIKFKLVRDGIMEARPCTILQHDNACRGTDVRTRECHAQRRQQKKERINKY